MLTRRSLLALAAGAIALSLPAFAAERVPFDRPAFEAAIASGAPVLIDVSATWCGTCAAQNEVLSRLTGTPKYSAIETFVVDYDAQKDVMRDFGVAQRSTLIVFKGGREVGRLTGITRAPVIEALLAKAI